MLDPFGATIGQLSKAGSGGTWTLCQEQNDWLNTTLQQVRKPFTFVFLHNLVGGVRTAAHGGSEASVFRSGAA